MVRADLSGQVRSIKININKICKREILIQLPREPREQHLGELKMKSQGQKNVVLVN